MEKITGKCKEEENLNNTITGSKTESDLNYEKQLQEFAEYINTRRKTKGCVIYTREITERINTLYKLGVKPGTINSLYQHHLFYCGKTAIVIDINNVLRPLLDWASQEEYDSTVLRAVIDWLTSDNNLEGLNLLELTTSILGLFDRTHGEWTPNVTYGYIKKQSYTPCIFATTTLPDDTGVVLDIPIRYDVYKKKYVLDIRLAYTDDRYNVECMEVNGFEIDINKEGFEEFSAKLTEVLTTYDEIYEYMKRKRRYRIEE